MSLLGDASRALVSSVAFELAQEGLRIGGPVSVAIGLATGTVAFFVADRAVSRIGVGPAEGPRDCRWRSALSSTASRSRRFSVSASPRETASALRYW